MATTYPGAKQSFTNPVGTNTLDDPDHAALHSDKNDTIEAIEDTIGTTSGTNILKSFTAGQFPVRNTGGGVRGTLVQTLVGGTIDSSTLGTPTIGTATITGGNINAATLGTPVIGTIAVSGTSTPLSIGASLAPTVVVLSDAGTVAVNAQAGQVFSLTFGTATINRTIANPTNAIDGQILVFRVKQNATSNGTLLWDTNFKFANGTAGSASIGTTASTWNYFGFRYNVTGTTFDEQGKNTNII